MKYLVGVMINAELSVEAESESEAREKAQDVVQGLHELTIDDCTVVTVDEDGE